MIFHKRTVLELIQQQHRGGQVLINVSRVAGPVLFYPGSGIRCLLTRDPGSEIRDPKHIFLIA